MVQFKSVKSDKVKAVTQKQTSGCAKTTECSGWNVNANLEMTHGLNVMRAFFYFFFNYFFIAKNMKYQDLLKCTQLRMKHYYIEVIFFHISNCKCKSEIRRNFH